jgi:CheY-like chemotaxis protein
MTEDADELIAHLTVDGRRPRVAIVGGGRANAMIATILIQQFGCEPLTAAGGEAALALLRADPAIDLMVLDLSVPDMDGIVAAAVARWSTATCDPCRHRRRQPLPPARGPPAAAVVKPQSATYRLEAARRAAAATPVRPRLTS